MIDTLSVLRTEDYSRAVGSTEYDHVRPLFFFLRTCERRSTARIFNQDRSWSLPPPVSQSGAAVLRPECACSLPLESGPGDLVHNSNMTVSVCLLNNLTGSFSRGDHLIYYGAQRSTDEPTLPGPNVQPQQTPETPSQYMVGLGL